jgi:hypothetical protein
VYQAPRHEVDVVSAGPPGPSRPKGPTPIARLGSLLNVLELLLVIGSLRILVALMRLAFVLPSCRIWRCRQSGERVVDR